MVFKCQEDSFLKEFESKVVICEPKSLKQKNNDGKTEVVNGFDVVLEDTILFPEGGGQPCDFGLMNGKPVLDVQRKGTEAHHFVADTSSTPPFSVGDSVRSVVDWKRRHDHMQQHSGQHLLSAVILRDDINTLSWSLGQDVSYIEIDPKINVSQEQLDKVENICNEAIAAATPVGVHVIKDKDANDVPPEISRATKGLPKDHVGDIRVITIEGIDNMCCGTHVRNLAQLQCIKILNAEKIKNRQYIYFLVGDRVMKRLHECFTRECELTAIFNNGPKSHVDLAKKMQANQKSTQKALSNCLKELAVGEANKLKAMNPQPKWYSIHRKDGIDTDFNSVFLKNAPEIKGKAEDGLSLLFITTSDDQGKVGNMLLEGDEKVIADLGDQICNLLDGKGKGKGKRFQARVNQLKKIAACEKLIEEYFLQN